MQMTDEMLYDTRLVERHIARGFTTREAYVARLTDLKDAEARSESIKVSVSNVGVTNVRAKITGEHE